MSDFLRTMAQGSADRCEADAAATPLAELQARLADVPAPWPLHLSGFDVLAEVKLAAPSVGVLRVPEGDRSELVVGQASAYGRGGAAAISVLTEPERFHGRLDDLQAVARAVAVPVMRKDFLVDPYQIWQARAAGASGVLLIAAILDDDAMARLDALAGELGMFVLWEAFDEDDLRRIARVVRVPPAPGQPRLVGVNTRNLRTLQVDPDRLEGLASRMPPGAVAVAESGMASAADVGRAAALGYRMALVGSALMASDGPEALLRSMIEQGRARC